MKKPVGESLENLIRNILIIDPDQSDREQLSGILSEMRAQGDAGVHDASVSTLKAAQDYMNDVKPYVIIIDPDCAPLGEVLSFIKRNRRFFPIWVLNSKDPHWWNTHKEALQKDPFGKRLETYYYLNKDRPSTDFTGHLLATLAKCNFDFQTRLLKDQTENLLSDEAGAVPREQLRKMIDKVNKSILAHLVRALALPNRKIEKEKTAFVAMSFDTVQKKRYESIIEPLLRAEGFTPIMYLNEYPDGPIPSDVFNTISTCSLFIGDITNLSPNVLIEVGAAVMANMPRILIAKKARLKIEEVPFMIDRRRIEFYTSDPNLSALLKAALEGKRKKTATYGNTN